MPGIAGLITKLPPQPAKQQLLRMVDSLRHDLSYRVGSWSDESLGIYVGWSARGNEPSAKMPLHDRTGRVTLVFSGEEFSQRGNRSGGNSPTSGEEADQSAYLLDLYENNPSFVADLNGRFQGLLLDQNLGVATLFNDRYGMHRIYYYQSRDAFYFAAEAKALLAVCPELRVIDARGLGEFTACGCVLENRTIFRGLNVLPPGSAWTFRDGTVEHRGCYFEPKQWEAQTTLPPETYYQELKQVFSHSLQRYFGGTEKIGISLTGGLDTRMILAWHKAGPGTLPCYTFGGMFHECQDVTMARRVAKQYGQTHQVLPAGAEFLKQFAHYAERTVYLTDGCVNVSHAPDLYLNGLAAQIAPIRMTGNYGGEILRQVRAFKPGRPADGLFRPEFMHHIQAAADTYAGLLREHPLTFAAFRQAPWHHYGLLALEQSQLSLRTPYLDNEFVKTVFRAPESALLSDDISLRLIADGDPALRRIRTDRGVGGKGVTSAALHRYLEFTFKAEYAYDYGMPQWMAKIDHSFSALHLERLFLGRHKFYHYRIWYRDMLADYVQQMLLDPRSLSRPYVESKAVQAIVEGHLHKGRNHTTQIHQLLTLELMHRLFLDAA